jgi:hypothetical protein
MTAPMDISDPTPEGFDELHHLNTCPGCWVCNHLIEFYETCDQCGRFAHMTTITCVVTDGIAFSRCTSCWDKYERQQHRPAAGAER